MAQIVGSTTNYSIPYVNTFRFSKGDYVEFFADSSVDASYTIEGAATGRSWFSITRVDKNMFGMNERVAARAVQTSGQSIPNTGTSTLVTWDTAETFDTNGAFNPATGLFTAPVDGDYRVSTSLLYSNPTWNVNDAANISIFKNGVLYSRFIFNVQATTSMQVGLPLNDLVRLNAGDTISIYTAHTRTGGSAALSTANGVNFVAISKEN
jgi:hypothetical protein